MSFSVKIDGQLVEIDEKDIWTKPNIQKSIIRHGGVRRLMVRAGIKVESLEVVITPSETNGMRTAFVAVGSNADGRRAFAVGEADAANLQPNSVAAKFATVMAAKRAVDRLALDLLGLFDLYSETELASNGENGSEPSPTAESGSSPSQSRTPDADAPGSSNGNGDTPATEKQLNFLRGLAQRSGMEPEEVRAMMEAATTRKAASHYISYHPLLRPLVRANRSPRRFRWWWASCMRWEVRPIESRHLCPVQLRPPACRLHRGPGPEVQGRHRRQALAGGGLLQRR